MLYELNDNDDDDDTLYNRIPFEIFRSFLLLVEIHTKDEIR